MSANRFVYQFSSSDGALSPKIRVSGALLNDPNLAPIDFDVVLGRTAEEYSVSVNEQALLSLHALGMQPMNVFAQLSQLVRQKLQQEDVSELKTQNKSGVWSNIENIVKPSGLLDQSEQNTTKSDAQPIKSKPKV